MEGVYLGVLRFTTAHGKFFRGRAVKRADLSMMFTKALVQITGAAFGASMSTVPEWQAGYDAFYVGGLLDAVVSPAGGFGKF